jgi:hypothetical protein
MLPAAKIPIPALVRLRMKASPWPLKVVLHFPVATADLRATHG